MTKGRATAQKRMDAIRKRAGGVVVPTSATDTARIDAMFHALTDYLGNLYMRWLDESEYEDIEDYGKAIASQLPEGFTLTAMTKRPFGFRFMVGTSAVYHMTVTADSVQWRRYA